MIKILKGMLVFGVLSMVSGCSEVVSDEDYTADIEGLAVTYNKRPTHEAAAKIFDLIDEIRENRSVKINWSESLKGRLSVAESDPLKSVVKTLISQDEYDLVLRIYDVTGFTEENTKLLNQNYDGNLGELDYLIAGNLFKYNHLKSAYTRLANLTAQDDTYTPQLRGFLQHYGCVETDAVWAEFSRSSAISQLATCDRWGGGANLTFCNGSKYPDLPVTAGFDVNLSSLRKDLRQGAQPSLQDDCPINLYD